MDMKILKNVSPVEWMIRIVAVGFAAFQLYTGITGTLDSLMQRELHLIFALVLSFLIFPGSKKRKRNTLNVIDVLILLFIGFIFFYLLKNYTYIRGMRAIYVTPYTVVDYIVSIGLIVVILEATRRVLGKMMMLVVIVGILYTFVGQYLFGILRHMGFSLEMFLDSQVFTMQGIFGTPLGVASTYLFIFIFFGTVLNSSGFGELLITLSKALAGNLRGGPAKIAVLASAAFGMISGSSTANAVTTGTFTIPMMKKIGLSPEFSSGVEAAASTGGQIMPPLLGAAALLMVDFAGVSYVQIMKWSIVPAIMYFYSIWCMIEFRSRRVDVKASEKEDVDWKGELRKKWHLIIPVVVLVYMLLIGRSIYRSGTVAVIGAFIVSSLRKETRMSFKSIINVMIDASKQALTVSIATASAGIFVGVVGLTSLGLKFSSLIVSFSSGYLLIALLFTMVAGLILGMGLPTAPAYIVQVALIVPALIKLGVPLYVAHLFVVYFAPMSMITPPVAITAYAAAGVGKADQFKTSVEAVKLAIAGFIVPFIFVYNQGLLLEGSSWLETTQSIVFGLIGIYCLAFSIQRYWYKKLNIIQTVLGLIAAICLISAGWVSDLVGLGIAIILYFWQKKLPTINFKQKEA